MSNEIQRALFGVVLGVAFLIGGCAGNDGAPCDPSCGEFEVCCAGTCVFTTADPLNCGGCGIACPSGTCSMGTCGPGTGPDANRTDGGGGGGDCGGACSDEGPDATHRCCGGACVARAFPQGTNGTSDPSFMNCNGCGIGCDAMRANSCSVPGGGPGTARCMCGDFDACRTDEVCVNEGGTFMCVSTGTDPMNCGMIGNACAPGETCLGGMCVCGGSGSACNAGEACCAGSCTPVLSDAMNCGACGVACGVNAPNCNNGTCGCGTGSACREATAPMSGFPIPIPIPIPGSGGDPGELCCAGACVANDETNCGTCGNMCTGTDECAVATPLLGGAAEICCLEPDPGPFDSCGGGGFPFPFDAGGIPLDAGI